MNRLHDKTVLVVDGGHGLGRAAALAFAHEGARVVVGEREVAAGEETVTAIVRAGGTAEVVVLDPLLSASCERAVQRAVEVFGTLDVLCSRVATAPARRQLLHETSEEEWDAVFAACVTAAVLPTRSALRVMRENGGGSIIVIGSSAALVGVPYLSAYSASQGVLLNLVRGLAVDGCAAGIRANCLCLGTTFDPLVPSEMEAHTLARIAPEEIAPVLVFLAADESRHITGQIVAADDGMTAWR